MKVAAVLFAVFLWLLAGLFFLAALHPDAVAQGKTLPRAVVGGGLLLGGVVLLAMAFRGGATPAPSGQGGGGAVTPQEPPGPLSLKVLTCPHCGGQVDPSTAKLNPEGTLSVTCGYCGGTFLVQEEPKW